VEKLDTVLRSIIRCAIAEIFIGEPIEKAVLSSEYTNLASNFFDGKEIGFINGITDKLYDRVVKEKPFKEKAEDKKTVA
jgi:N utilization substance protein B